MEPGWAKARALAGRSKFFVKVSVVVGVAALLPISGVSAATPTRGWSPEEQVTANGDDNSTWVRPEYLVGSAADGTTVAIWGTSATPTS